MFRLAIQTYSNTEQGFTIQFDLYPYNFNDPSTPSADYLIWKIDESAGDGANGKGFDIGFNNQGLFFRYHHPDIIKHCSANRSRRFITKWF